MKQDKTDQLRINGSTVFWINGSTMKVNAQTTKMKKRKLPCIFKKKFLPAEYAQLKMNIVAVINACMCLVVYNYIYTIACV